MTVKPITESSEVFAIYETIGFTTETHNPRLWFCMWEDGTVVWCSKQEDTNHYISKVDASVPRTVLARLDCQGIFTVRGDRTDVGVDFTYDTILIRHQGNEFRLESSHRWEEAAMLTHGSYFGEKVIWYHVLSEKPAQFLFFRFLWNELETIASGCIPANGTKTLGRLSWCKGVGSWIDDKNVTVE